MKRQNEYHLNIGGASIILLLVVIALTIFAILSVRASYHEKKLADKTRESIEEYYTADSKAEKVYAELSTILAKLPAGDVTAEQLAGQSSYRELISVENDNELSYIVGVNDLQEIEVKLTLSAERALMIKSWRLSENESGEYSSGFDFEIWDGFLEVE